MYLFIIEQTFPCELVKKIFLYYYEKVNAFCPVVCTKILYLCIWIELKDT